MECRAFGERLRRVLAARRGTLGSERGPRRALFCPTPGLAPRRAFAAYQFAPEAPQARQISSAACKEFCVYIFCYSLPSFLFSRQDHVRATLLLGKGAECHPRAPRAARVLAYHRMILHAMP